MKKALLLILSVIILIFGIGCDNSQSDQDAETTTSYAHAGDPPIVETEQFYSTISIDEFFNDLENYRNFDCEEMDKVKLCQMENSKFHQLDEFVVPDITNKYNEMVDMLVTDGHSMHYTFKLPYLEKPFDGLTFNKIKVSWYENSYGEYYRSKYNFVQNENWECKEVAPNVFWFSEKTISGYYYWFIEYNDSIYIRVRLHSALITNLNFCRDKTAPNCLDFLRFKMYEFTEAGIQKTADDLIP